MPDLPKDVSWKEAVAAFKEAGFNERKPKGKKKKGNHVVLVKVGHVYHLSVPRHDTLKVGTLRALIRAADLTIEQFVGYLGR